MCQSEADRKISPTASGIVGIWIAIMFLIQEKVFEYVRMTEIYDITTASGEHTERIAI